MKDLDTIQNLTDGQLEKIAGDVSVKMPERLRESLSLICPEEDEASRRRRSFWLPAAAAAAIVAGVFIFTGNFRRPKDTFSDPYLAYAEVERTFAFVSDKMDKGIQTAGKAVPVIQKTDDILEMISK